mmetsp:Transcript_115489/g.337820  ORF Transcript_115489/g.337820 Transcript_115489/m.337820 type:complete len:294 (-) Transcript_115489:577-1458(-)
MRTHTAGSLPQDLRTSRGQSRHLPSRSEALAPQPAHAVGPGHLAEKRRLRPAALPEPPGRHVPEVLQGGAVDGHLDVEGAADSAQASHAARDPLALGGAHLDLHVHDLANHWLEEAGHVGLRRLRRVPVLQGLQQPEDDVLLVVLVEVRGVVGLVVRRLPHLRAILRAVLCAVTRPLTSRLPQRFDGHVEHLLPVRRHAGHMHVVAEKPQALACHDAPHPGAPQRPPLHPHLRLLARPVARVHDLVFLRQLPHSPARGVVPVVVGALGVRPDRLPTTWQLGGWRPTGWRSGMK